MRTLKILSRHWQPVKNMLTQPVGNSPYEGHSLMNDHFPCGLLMSELSIYWKIILKAVCWTPMYKFFCRVKVSSKKFNISDGY